MNFVQKLEIVWTRLNLKNKNNYKKELYVTFFL